MFKKSTHTSHRKSGSAFGKIFGLFRLLLSFVIMSILLLGVYQAYKTFSGVDPLTTDPKSIFKSILSSEDAFSLIEKLLSVDPGNSLEKATGILGNSDKSSSPSNSSELSFKFAIVTDSHNDSANLSKALAQAKESNAEFALALGDFTDVGTLEDLKKAKEVFEASGMVYYVTPGDHDLWDSRDKKNPASKNFQETFGSLYTSFGYKNARFLLVYNADNYLGLDDLQLRWLEDELIRVNQEGDDLIFVGMGIPIYHPSSDHIMGKSEGKLKPQAQHLVKLFKDNNVDEVFAGDTHFYSRYTEPLTTLKMTAVGAVTSNRNPQKPRYVLVDVFKDGSYNVSDVEIR